MTAARHDFVVEQGTTWTRSLEYKNADGTPYVLTGWTARMQVRQRHGSTDKLLDLAVGTGLAIASNVVTITVTAAQTALLPAGRSVYDLEIVAPTGEVTRLIEGSFLVDVEVTRVDA